MSRVSALFAYHRSTSFIEGRAKRVGLRELRPCNLAAYASLDGVRANQTKVRPVTSPSSGPVPMTMHAAPMMPPTKPPKTTLAILAACRPAMMPIAHPPGRLIA